MQKTWEKFTKHFIDANAARLLKEPATASSQGYNSANAAATNDSANAAVTDENKKPAAGTKLDNGSTVCHVKCCFTHGLFLRGGHNSDECRSPSENHKKNATCNNCMGGSTAWDFTRAKIRRERRLANRDGNAGGDDE